MTPERKQHQPVTDQSFPRHEIPAVDEFAREAARARQLTLTKPSGALGRLEDVSIWAAGVQGQCPPQQFADVRVVIFAGDHGIAKSGVSAYPSEVTAQMVLNFLAGGAAANVLARAHSAKVRVYDLGVDSELASSFPEDVAAYKIRRGSGSIDREDALSPEELKGAWQAGIAIADAQIDEGADLLIVGDMGIGNTTPVTALLSALTGIEPVALIGRGTGVDDAGWMRKAEAIRDAVHRGSDAAGDPQELLRRCGGADLVAVTSFMIRAAERRTPIVLDGIVSAVCGLFAARIAPGVQAWWIAGHRSTEPSQTTALAELGLEPIIELGMRLGEGTGALTALPLIQAAIATLGEMATFGDAGVSDRE